MGYTMEKRFYGKEDGMNIREMTAGDYGKVHELWKESPGVGLRSLDDAEGGIKKFLERNPGASFVAEEDGELAGAVLSGCDGRRACIYHAAVREKFRGRGAGKALVKAVEAAMSRAGINKIGLVALKTNIAASRFWKALDYNVREDLAYRDKSLNPENV
jgi:ribosomal protein S18 acetylase RimI-like enzyme